MQQGRPPDSLGPVADTILFWLIYFSIVVVVMGLLVRFGDGLICFMIQTSVITTVITFVARKVLDDTLESTAQQAMLACVANFLWLVVSGAIIFFLMLIHAS